MAENEALKAELEEAKATIADLQAKVRGRTVSCDDTPRLLFITCPEHYRMAADSEAVNVRSYQHANCASPFSHATRSLAMNSCIF